MRTHLPRDESVGEMPAFVLLPRTTPSVLVQLLIVVTLEDWAGRLAAAVTADSAASSIVGRRRWPTQNEELVTQYASVWSLLRCPMLCEATLRSTGMCQQLWAGYEDLSGRRYGGSSSSESTGGSQRGGSLSRACLTRTCDDFSFTMPGRRFGARPDSGACPCYRRLCAAAGKQLSSSWGMYRARCPAP
jgi:hypothetical protein